MDEKKISFNKEKSFLLGILLAFFILYFSIIKSDKKNFEEFALTKDATLEFGKVDNLNIHCGHLSDINKCLNDYQKFGKNLPVVLWLGNSQLHVINQFSKGEETASKKLYRSLIDQGHYLFAFSQPNSNLQEQLLITSYLFQRLPIKNIILPVVFDDMREIKIRSDVETVLYDESSKKLLLENSKNGIDLYHKYVSQVDSQNVNSNRSISLQENSENFLNHNLKNISSLWSGRDGLRGHIFVTLYQIRNFVFQIKPSSIRKMIPDSYTKNFQALTDLVNISKTKEANIFIYNAPIRSDLKIPYKLSEYNKFKYDLEKLSKDLDIKYQNFENIIPNSLWGKKNSTTINKEEEIDFMHFRAEGHDLLANIIFRELKGSID